MVEYGEVEALHPLLYVSSLPCFPSPPFLLLPSLPSLLLLPLPPCARLPALFLPRYIDVFQEAGGSMVSLAKGNRSMAVTNACNKHGGFYLGSIGGPAAVLAQNCIKNVEVLEYEELGMEAVWKIEVENFPAFIVVDDKGNDFFAEWQT